MLKNLVIFVSMAAAQVEQQLFYSDGSVTGTLNNMDEVRLYDSHLKCSLVCLDRRCRGFAVDENTNKCVLEVSPEQIPMGTWTIYRNGETFCLKLNN